MALQERIFGLETEYAINFYPAKADDARPDAQTMVKALHSALAQLAGVQNSTCLVTGASFFHDVGHAEWAQAECRGAREAAAYDKAADHLLARALPFAQELLLQDGHRGHLLVAKNNVDFEGHTYGCHENYLMVRDGEFLTGEHFLRYLARVLIPFLVTRQVFAGSGRLVADSQHLSYEISQRAAFIDTIVSGETIKERPIFNIGREAEPLAAHTYRRLHLILGDANLSGWATWMKLGTTAIIVRMIEDMCIVEMPLLRDPLAALRIVARDPSCRDMLPLRDGRLMSALDIQRFYYEHADAYLDEFGSTDEEDALMDAWDETLLALEHDPMRLRDRVDWVIKKRALDTYLGATGLSWEQAAADQAAVRGLQAYDLRFHDISHNGLYSQFFSPDTLITPEEIERAQRQPPPYTRARMRGEAIIRARQWQIPVTIEKWTELVLQGKKIEMLDPLEFAHPDFPFSGQPSVPLLQETGVRATPLSQEELTWLQTIATHPDSLLRRRAAAYLGWHHSQETLALLREMVCHDPEDTVRLAAIQTLGTITDPGATDILIQCLEDPLPAVRWVAQATLEHFDPSVLPQQSSDSDDGEHLIQLIP